MNYRETIELCDDKIIETLCRMIKRYNVSIKDNLAAIVAEMSCVEAEDMMKDTSNLSNVQARWFYWYAYRYLTNESYYSIATNTEMGRKFAPSCVGASIGKMQVLISSNTIWRKRWEMLKRIIKASMDCNDKEMQLDLKDTITVTVNAPRGVNIEVKQN